MLVVATVVVVGPAIEFVVVVVLEVLVVLEAAVAASATATTFGASAASSAVEVVVTVRETIVSPTLLGATVLDARSAEPAAENTTADTNITSFRVRNLRIGTTPLDFVSDRYSRYTPTVRAPRIHRIG